VIDRVRNRKTAPPPSAGPIPRDLLDKLAEMPWYEPYAYLAAVAGAKSSEELERLSKGSNRAYCRLEGAVFKALRYPWDDATGELDHDRLPDANLRAALNRLVATMEQNPVFADPDLPEWAARLAGRLVRLRDRAWTYLRRGTTFPRS
jgi:hypothetical protein